MKTGDQVTLGMLSEFEFSYSTTMRFNAWAALEALDNGMSEVDMELIFNLTMDQLVPYKHSWSVRHEMQVA